MKKHEMRIRIVLATVLTTLLAPSVVARAADEAPPQVLITNVNVWDGTGDGLEKADVLIEGNLIKALGSGATAGSGATVIDGGVAFEQSVALDALQPAE